MGEDIRLGRIAGIPLAINWSVLVVVWLVTWSLAVGALPDVAPGHATASYWVAGLVGAVVLFGSLLAHELAHAVVARHAGLEVKGLTLWLFGGIAKLGSEPPTPQADLRIAIVGPLTSLALSVGFATLAVGLDGVGAADIVVATAVWLATINLLLALFNLIPGAPLDGGRVLRALLWRRHGDWARAAIGAARAGRVVGYSFIWLGLMEFLLVPGIGGLWLVFIGWFVLNASRAEQADVIARQVLADVRVGDIMGQHPHVAPGWITVGELIEHYLFGHPHSAYPVKDADGRIVGLVTLRQLRAVAAKDRAVTRVADVAIPLDEVPTAAPTEPLVTALKRLDDTSTGGRILVLQHEELVGIVTPTDVAHAIDIRTLADRSAPDTGHDTHLSGPFRQPQRHGRPRPS